MYSHTSVAAPPIRNNKDDTRVSILYLLNRCSSFGAIVSNPVQSCNDMTNAEKNVIIIDPRSSCVKQRKQKWFRE